MASVEGGEAGGSVTLEKPAYIARRRSSRSEIGGAITLFSAAGMFQSAYQDGDCVEVFSPAGKNPGSEWKSSGKIVRVYEKGVKGYVIMICICRALHIA